MKQPLVRKKFLLGLSKTLIFAVIMVGLITLSGLLFLQYIFSCTGGPMGGACVDQAQRDANTRSLFLLNLSLFATVGFPIALAVRAIVKRLKPRQPEPKKEA